MTNKQAETLYQLCRDGCMVIYANHLWMVDTNKDNSGYALYNVEDIGPIDLTEIRVDEIEVGTVIKEWWNND